MGRPAKITEKMCLRCRKIKPIEEFYRNRGWAEQQYADTVCRECARQLIVDKESARKYFWDNNRVWSEAIWTAAKNKADYWLANNAEYLNAKTSQKRKNEIETAAICAAVPSVMNTAVLYQFVENGTEEGRLPFNPNSVAGTTQETEMTRENEEQVWSDVWNGMYTKRELEYLDEYYKRLEDEFVLDNVNIEDYARRVAMASLDANNKYQRMRQGTGTSREWLEAQNVFDTMSKSARFAEIQRKVAGSRVMDALSTIIMDIEINHHNEMPQVTFPKDDIDKILHDFGFTGEAIA